MVPATTFAALALLAVVAGGGLTRWRWSVVLGVAIGCMSLSRTMSIAFIPGLGVPAIVWSITHGTSRLVMVRNAALAAVVGGRHVDLVVGHQLPRGVRLPRRRLGRGRDVEPARRPRQPDHRAHPLRGAGHRGARRRHVPRARSPAAALGRAGHHRGDHA